MRYGCRHLVELSPQCGQFHWVHALAVDAKGNVYTAEVDTGKRIQKFRLTSTRSNRD